MGGGVQTPPPAGGGKSRGPAGRGLTESFQSFQNIIRSLVPTICISRIFDISMTWVQVKIGTDLSIMSQWGKY